MSLKHNDETITGETLTTDFFLEVVSKPRIASRNPSVADELPGKRSRDGSM